MKRSKAPRLTCLVLLASLGIPTAVEADPGQWLHRVGAGELLWGTSIEPPAALPRSRELYLPDAAYLGRGPSDHPQDLELPMPESAHERRFLRYIGGQLVDAWLSREGPIDISDLPVLGTEQWRGTVLGPGEKGFRAFGDAISWSIHDRSMMWWRDRQSKREILVSRSVPAGGGSVVREAPLHPGPGGSAPVVLKGELKAEIKPWKQQLSGCLEAVPKPVMATISLVYDSQGRPSRIQADCDRPSPDILRCAAAALSESHAEPGTAGSFSVIRLR